MFGRENIKKTGNCDPGNTRGNLSILAPVRFNEIFGLMAWIHRVRKNLRPIPKERTHGTMVPIQWEEISKICKYRARSRSSSAVLGGKGFEKDGAHMFRAFAYLPMHNLHMEKFASCVHTRGEDERLPTGRSKEIRVSVHPHPRLVFS